jgi:hypothetical protein
VEAPFVRKWTALDRIAACVRGFCVGDQVTGSARVCALHHEYRAQVFRGVTEVTKSALCSRKAHAANITARGKAPSCHGNKLR